MKKVMIWVLMLCMGLLGSASAAWQGADVGTFGGTLTNPGAYTESNGVFTLTGDGADIWGSTDGCYFVYQEQWGDGDIICRVDSLVGGTTPSDWRKAGLMVRNSLDPNDVEVSMVAAPDQVTCTWQQRPTYGAATTSIRDNSQPLPAYLKITRIGNLFRGFWSADGVNWTEEASPGYQVDDMSETCYWGLVITSHDVADTATAKISHLDGVKGQAVEAGDKPSYTAPDYLAVDQPLSNVLIDWDEPVNGAPEKYLLYVGSIKSNYASSFDPNDMANEAVISPTTTSYTLASLDNDSTYFWRVDAIYADVNGVGDIWKFDTVKKDPTILTQPVGGMINPSCPLTIEAVAEMVDPGDTLTYQLYKDNVAVGAPAASGVFDVYDEGAYKIEVISALWDNVMSDEVQVSLYKHWKTPVKADIGDTQAGALDLSVPGKVSVTGSGADIWGAADAFTFAYIEKSGDFEVSAKIESITGGGNEWRKAGLMIRESLAAGSTHATIAITNPDNSNADTQWAHASSFQGRVTTDSDSTNNDLIPEGYAGLPYYVKLARVGDDFTASVSPDGEVWTDIATRETIMSADVYVGFAVTSHNVDELTTGTFSEITGLGKSWAATDPAYSPDPTSAESWIDPDSDLTLSWTNGEFAPCDATYAIYFGTDPENLAPLAGNVVGEAELDYESTYYWQVEVSYNGESEMGPAWSFDTIKRVPVILTDPPVISVIPAGEPFTLAAQASSLAILPVTKIELYKEAGETDILLGAIDDPPASDTQNGTLFYDLVYPIASPSVADEGVYYAVVYNDAAVDGVATGNGRIVIKRLMVELTFDDENDPLAETASGYDVVFAAPAAATEYAYPKWTAAGKVGGAIDMPGESDPNNGWIDVAKTASELGIVGNLPRTVSAWVYTRAFNDGGIWDMGNFADSQDFSLRTLGTDNNWRAQYWGGADFDTYIDGSDKWSSTATLNNWVMMTLVVDGTQSKLYVDGHVLNGKAGTLNTSDRLSLKVGTYQWNFTDMVASNIFDGLIDEFRLWNYALTGEEVAAMYYEATGQSQCAENLTYDLDADCKVTFTDIAIIAARWLEDGRLHPQQ